MPQYLTCSLSQLGIALIQKRLAVLNGNCLVARKGMVEVSEAIDSLLRITPFPLQVCHLQLKGQAVRFFFEQLAKYGLGLFVIRIPLACNGQAVQIAIDPGFAERFLQFVLEMCNGLFRIILQ